MGKGIVILSVGRSGREVFERRLGGDEPGGVELSRKRTASVKPYWCRAQREGRVSRGRPLGAEVRRSWGQSVAFWGCKARSG